MSYNHMESPWIKMKAKYKGSTCDNETCEKKIDVGQIIFWNKNTHRVRHEICHLEQVDEHTSDTSFVSNSFAETDEFDWKKHSTGINFRHGDLGIRMISVLPEDKILQNTDVLAEGEVTGHTHRLEGKFKIYKDLEHKFFEAFDEIKLVHQEHGPLKIPRGKYIIINEREKNPWDDEIREVED